MTNSNLVWSSDGGPTREPTSDRPPKPPRGNQRGNKRSRPPRRGSPDALPTDPNDGIVRLHRRKSAKGGKPGTLVVGLPGTDKDLDKILKQCKTQLGTGGTRQERVLVIQGDHRAKLQPLLEKLGHNVKLAGG